MVLQSVVANINQRQHCRLRVIKLHVMSTLYLCPLLEIHENLNHFTKDSNLHNYNTRYTNVLKTLSFRLRKSLTNISPFICLLNEQFQSNNLYRSHFETLKIIDIHFNEYHFTKLKHDPHKTYLSNNPSPQVLSKHRRMPPRYNITSSRAAYRKH